MSELDKEIIKAVMGRGYQEGMPIPGFVEKIKQAIEKHIIGENMPEDYAVPYSRIIQSDTTVGIDQVDRQKVYNELMADQRKKLHQK